jgi:predicted DCC family thiol-disulfide oxidoreductase YuxK
VDRYVLAYDADCGPCTRFKQGVDFLDAHRKIGFVSIDQAEESGLLDGIPETRRHRSFHLILPSKRVESGAEALPTLMGLFPSGRMISKIVESAPGGLPILAFVYSIASRLHEVGSCKTDV